MSENKKNQFFGNLKKDDNNEVNIKTNKNNELLSLIGAKDPKNINISVTMDEKMFSKIKELKEKAASNGVRTTHSKIITAILKKSLFE